MLTIAVVTAAAAPGLALLSYVYLKDRHATEPIRLVARLFIMGMLIVFPTMVLQRAVVLGTGASSWWYAFFVSALMEEFLKWFVLYFAIFKHEEFDEHYDGIVYAAAVSLGFATLENILYAFVYQSSFSALLNRAFLPVTGHALFGIAMGYYMGKAKFGRPELRKKKLLQALSIPILWHGVYDLVLLEAREYWMWLMFPLMGYFWTKALGKMSRANDRSPHAAAARNGSALHEREVKISETGS
ncbi:glutamic-type intramembrane protease PrsW [Paenibacillus thermoaerophilus]|uniref:Protease PrsW n=1 Tax=Paenibacillus thermoaerophilus TaxID=1215385 RepID=A0ABW2V2P7_9BACL|nr:glutamic-type intramembrane protease PrsW [Paenibacillus thermoaerophilus]TMV18729.1 intramembrane metalloprotease PrsW [Paenibacillus thermoaerophilus]